MRWLKPNLKSSLYALLGHASGPAPQHLDALMEHIRTAMLDLLGTPGHTAHPLLARRIRFATEIETLWYARNELMAARSSQVGEVQAQKDIARLSRLFEGLMPTGAAPKPGR